MIRRPRWLVGAVALGLASPPPLWPAAAAAAFVALPPNRLTAQATGTGAEGETQRTNRRIPRRILFTALGMVGGAAIGSIYFSSNDDNASPGICTSNSCVAAVAVLGGGFVGWMIGREFDQLHALRYRGGTPLEPPSEAVALASDPLVLALGDSLVAVAGGRGVQLFSMQLKEAGRRASGVRGIGAMEFAPGSGTLAIGSPSGLYLFPPQTGPGVLVRPGEARAAAATQDRIYFAVGNRIEAAPVSADTAREWPGLELGRPVQSLFWEAGRGVLWASTDSALVALRPAADSLERLGTVAIPAPARHITVAGGTLALALGEAGVAVYDVADAAAPRETMRWTTARFVYDVSLVGTRLFAASGVEGVYVLDVGGASPVTVGLARDLGFAVALGSQGGYTFLIDRSTNSLRRIPSTF